MGDFNPNLLMHERVQMLHMMYANALIPLIDSPTRVTGEISTLIDNTFMNSCVIKSAFSSGILKTDMSDHCIVFHLKLMLLIYSRMNTNL